MVAPHLPAQRLRRGVSVHAAGIKNVKALSCFAIRMSLGYSSYRIQT
jgi:hypothetical protein